MLAALHCIRLRICPLCGADAVDWWRRERVGVRRERIELHCACCGVRRRVGTTIWAANAYQRRYELDRAAIAAALRRMRRDRACEEGQATRTRGAS
jgi:hypothetical protein